MQNQEIREQLFQIGVALSLRGLAIPEKELESIFQGSITPKKTSKEKVSLIKTEWLPLLINLEQWGLVVKVRALIAMILETLFCEYLEKYSMFFFIFAAS